ncbi:Bug family tripartite tricarboxylate transporter substrate binding protein [Ramlibacter albus]|uniref:Tripartite tricarboxylate transporter substrate binding protein n=1 Tax=Ramlibacter albus TaxID=2079448 RepID=A0A923S3D1_9BURK|nr:tripartite tricarboxylate transporter substrate binding protein [Ramlibacter albus]MBC5762997.1 tripartite tricarboxylate transporter substrate binding protein [Ramlibacter albus]
MKRRSFALLAAAAAVPWARHGWADNYPSRPIRVVTPIAPGGLADRVTRLFARHLSTRVSQAVVVENKPGGGGALAMDSVAKAPGDGYTLGFTFIGPAVVNPILSKSLPYELTDLAPLARIAEIHPFVLVAAPNIDAQSLSGLIKVANGRPQPMFYGSAGNASLSHLTMELFSRAAGFKVQHVPYKGESPMVVDLMAGTLATAFVSVEIAAPLVKSGKLKAIAVANRQRSSQLPDVPTIAEAGYPDFSAAGFFGFVASAKVPRTIVEQLNGHFNAITDSPEVRADFASFGIVPVTESPRQFGELLAREHDKWSRLVRETGITS